MTQASFSQLPLPAELLENLSSLDYQAMTPIQAASLPHILAGRDLIAKAKTGSGKTAAFGLGLLSKLNPSQFQVQALVLCPTRELADQVGKELRRLARQMQNVKVLVLCGGTPLGPQLGSLEHGAHIIVGTPGRILEHLGKGSLKLDRLACAVLDEADRMLDMGFIDSIEEILDHTPNSRQTLLFSATYPVAIRQLSARFQRDPMEVSVDQSHAPNQIEQYFYEVDPARRDAALVGLLAHYRPESAVIFCNTKQDCRTVAENLQNRGLHALALHGDLEQRDRDQVLVQFANKSCSFLVATDVAARGLDIKELPAVINFELPRDPEVYVHRVGRTGRAGQAGLALNLCTPAEIRRAQVIEDGQKAPLAWRSLDSLPDQPDLDLTPPMVTLCIAGGRKNKIRPGDILGALTQEAGLNRDQVGKIDISEFYAYVAVDRNLARRTCARLNEGKIKGRHFRVRTLR